MSARKLSDAIRREETYVSACERRGIVPPWDTLVLIEDALPGFSALRMCELALDLERAAPAPVAP